MIFQQFETQLISQKQEYEAKLSNQKHEYEAKLANREKEHELELANKISELKKLGQLNAKKDREIKELNEEMIRIRNKSSLGESEPIQNHEIEILDENTINDFEKIIELGNGGGGKVFKVFKKIFYALKEMNVTNESSSNLQNFLKEYEIMNILKHPNILKTYGIFLSNENKPPSILLENCPNNLESMIKNKMLDNVHILFSIYQIAEGMKYVHFNKIIHRDLKPTNILILEDGTIKICDFGISKLMSSEEQTMTRGVGSQKFMAPEIINEESVYDEKVDVYSFGVVLYFMLSGGKLPSIKMVDILTGKKAEIPSTFTQLAKDLINSCWNFYSKDRPSFKDICETISINDYKLIELTNFELKELNELIAKYKLQIPKYE